MHVTASGQTDKRISGRESEPTLFPSAHPLNRPSALPVLDQRIRGTVYFEQPARSILNPPESTGMSFWSLNPYIGCEFGCSYCYARFAHRFAVERAGDSGALDSRAWAAAAFEQKIFVKQKAAVLAALEHDLAGFRKRQAASGAEDLAIGTSTDPYQPAERQFGITRAVLERLTRE